MAGMERLWLVGALIFASCADSSSATSDAATTSGTFADETGTDPTSSSAVSAGGSTATTSTSATSSHGDSSTDSSANAESTGVPPAVDGPARYPAGLVHSPITPYVADALRELTIAGPARADDVFMKAGASSEASRSNLRCFDTGPYDLADHRDLAPTLAHFLAGDAAGVSPFLRESAAVTPGRTAMWAVAGDPSPLQVEIDAIAPAIALVHFGTNDMELGITPATALVSFYDAMSELLDVLMAQGVVPVLVGITRRGDDAADQLWVGTYNGVLRGLAQQRQVLFLDVYQAVDPLPGHGLAVDGLHLRAAPEGACLLDRAGLEYGYNMRNLIQLEALDRLDDVLVEGAPSLDAVTPANSPPSGAGTEADPIEVDTFPFADTRDTDRFGPSRFDAYPACDDADESGPEVVYRIELDEPLTLRAVVLDRVGVDVDLHVIAGELDPAGCVARADTWLAGTLGAGVHHLVVDTWAVDGLALTGSYLLLLTPCEPDDEACAATF